MSESELFDESTELVETEDGFVRPGPKGRLEDRQ